MKWIYHGITNAIRTAAGSIWGFIGYITAHYELGLMYGYWCYPETTGTVTVNQLMLVVKKWLENNPKVLHEPAAIVTRYALSEAFPCSK